MSYQYPTRIQICEAVENCSNTFLSDNLNGFSPIIFKNRILMYAGGFNCVFPLINVQGEKIALRIWIKEINNAKKRVVAISRHLKKIDRDYLVSSDYIDDGILINSTCHPTVLMNWVEGPTLKDYIDKNIQDKKKMSKLIINFKWIFSDMHKHKIAHGDLQHNNILVNKRDKIKLVDYDSMYVKDIEHLRDVIKGLPGYQHPFRYSNEFLTHQLDYFSEYVILLSMLVFNEEPKLWNRYYNSDNLLFSSNDFQNPHDSVLFKYLSSHKNKKIVYLTRFLKSLLKEIDICCIPPIESVLNNDLRFNKEKLIEKFNKSKNSIKNEIYQNIINKF